MRIVFLGPPGAGKGTQSEKICKAYRMRQLSTGDILRANVRDNTELGRKAKSYMNAGELVPDDIIIEMIREELDQKGENGGYILDGFPRTVPQAEAFDRMLEERNERLDSVLVLDVPEKELINRLTARRNCRVCGRTYHMIYNPPIYDNMCDADGSQLYQRDDDKEETVLNRLKVYEGMTRPLIDYYSKKGIARFIDGEGDLEEIFRRIREALEGK